jgi:hypothetical protein
MRCSDSNGRPVEEGFQIGDPALVHDVHVAVVLRCGMRDRDGSDIVRSDISD